MGYTGGIIQGDNSAGDGFVLRDLGRIYEKRSSHLADFSR